MQNENLICSNWDFNRIQCSNWTAFSRTKYKRLFLSFIILFVILWWYYVSLSTKMKVFFCLVWRHDVITSVHIRRHQRYIISCKGNKQEGKLLWTEIIFWLYGTITYSNFVKHSSGVLILEADVASRYRISTELSGVFFTVRHNIYNHRYKHPSSQACSYPSGLKVRGSSGIIGNTLRMIFL